MSPRRAPKPRAGWGSRPRSATGFEAGTGDHRAELNPGEREQATRAPEEHAAGPDTGLFIAPVEDPADSPLEAEPRWRCPEESPEYQRMRTLCVQHGLPAQLWDEVCFSISALPSLRGHGVVLQRMHSLLEEPVFSGLQTWPAASWTARLPQWRRLLSMWPQLRLAYAQGLEVNELDPLTPSPAGKRAGSGMPRHPMSRHGYTVAPLASVLWIAHPFEHDPDPAQCEIAQRFRRLQAMLLALALQMRWTSNSEPADYLRHTPEASVEFAPVPVAIGPACRSARWLAKPEQAGIVAELPDEDHPLEYAHGMCEWAQTFGAEPEVLALASAEARRKHSYPGLLASAFQYFPQLLEPGYVPGRRRRASPAPGSDAQPEVVVENDAGATTSAPADGAPVSGPTPTSGTVTPVVRGTSPVIRTADPDDVPTVPGRTARDRAAGLAESDLQSPGLPLVPVQEIARGLSSAKWQAMHQATGAVGMPWLLNRYSAEQVSALAARANRMIDPSAQVQADLADGALLALLVASLGREPEELAGLRVVRLVEHGQEDMGPDWFEGQFEGHLVEHEATGAPGSAPGDVTGNTARRARGHAHGPGPARAPDRDWLRKLRFALRMPLSAPVLLVRHTAGASEGSVSGSNAVRQSLRPLAPLAFVLPTIGPRLAQGDAASPYEVDLRGLGVSARANNILLPAGGLGELVLRRMLQRASRPGPAAEPLPRPASEPAPAPPSSPGSPHHDPASHHPGAEVSPVARPRRIGVPVFPALQDLQSTQDFDPPAEQEHPTAAMPGQRGAGLTPGAAGPDARQLVLGFLAQLPPPTGHRGWALSTLKAHIGQIIEATSGDCTLAWLTTGDTARVGEARLHYTQHRLSRIAASWVDALPRAGLGILAHPLLNASGSVPTPTPAQSPSPLGSRPLGLRATGGERPSGGADHPDETPDTGESGPLDAGRDESGSGVSGLGKTGAQQPGGQENEDEAGDVADDEPTSATSATSDDPPDPSSDWLNLASANPQQPSLPQGWLDTLTPQEQSHLGLAVGAPFVAPVAQVAGLIKALQARLQETAEPTQRTAMLAHHDAIVLLTVVVQGLCTGMRAVRSPVTVARAVEQHDLVGNAATWARSQAKEDTPELAPERVYVGLADKETYYDERARLGVVPELLVQQWRVLRVHVERFVQAFGLQAQWEQASPPMRALFRLDDKLQMREVSVAWVEQQLAALGYPWPANFARAFLRTRLLEQGCPAADLDAFLGHRDPGGGAIGLHSGHDARLSLQRLEQHLHALHERIGLTAMRSALVQPGQHLDPPSQVLAPLQRCGPNGRGRSSLPRNQRPPSSLTPFWRAVHQRATDTDRPQVAVLARLLQRQARRGNAFAQVLAAADPLAKLRDLRTQPPPAEVTLAAQDGSSASELAAATWDYAVLTPALAEIVQYLRELGEAGNRTRQQRAASWFRLLLRATRKLAQATGAKLPDPPLVALVRPPPSPFIEQSVLIVPVVNGWQQALHNWMRTAFASARQAQAASAHAGAPASAGPQLQAPPSAYSAQGWGTALLMGAVLHGMLLDSTQLSMLLRRFCEGPRDLPVDANSQRAFLDFNVPASGAVDRQTHRWWLDPTSELIWLHAPPMPQTLRLGDLVPWLRRLCGLAFKGSAQAGYEPRSFGDLIRCGEVFWLTRAPRSVVAGARRQVDSSSLHTDRWIQIAGVSRLSRPGPGTHAQDFETDPPMAAAAHTATLPTEGKRRRRKVRIPRPGIEALCLLDFDGERSSSVSEPAREEREDESLIATMHALHPWVSEITDALRAVQDEPALLDAAAVLRTAQSSSPAAAPIASVLARFAVWLTVPEGKGKDDGTSQAQGAEFSGPALPRCFSAAAQAVLLAQPSAPGEDTIDADKIDADTPDADTLEGNRLHEAQVGTLGPEAIVAMLHTSEELRMRSGASAKSLRDALLRLEQFLRIEGAALDQAKSRDDGPDPFAQPSPDHDATGQPAAADPDEDLDDEDKVRTTIDARVITLEEFHETIELLLVAEHGSLTKYERGLARLALTLCLRLGLRPPEVFALRLCDIEDDYVYVLPYDGYAPKSNNGVRRVPLSVFLKPAELERLREFIARKRNANASPQSLLLTGANGAPPPRPRVEPFIKKVLRHVSEHPGTRLYTARHSFASWTYLALLSVDYPEIRSFFTHLKGTSAYLESGPALMTKLFGSQENALGKATFAITKLVGHIGPAITRMHYLHGDDLVRYAVVIREAALAHPIQWMELLDLKRSHTYKLLQDGAQLQTLVRRTRTALGWRVSPELDAGGNGRPRYLPRPVDPSPALVPQKPAAAASAASAAPAAAGSGASTPRPALPAATRPSGPAGNGGDAGGDGWIDPRTLLRILQPVAHEAQDISEAARYYRLDAQRLKALFEAFKQALPAVAQPGKAGTREAEAGRASVQHGLDIMALLTSAERYFASRASRDPVGLASDIAFLLDCYDRRDRDFHVRRSADLTRLVSLFEAMSIPPSYVQVILRSAQREEAPPLPECAQAGELAGYAASPRKCVGVRSAEKAASYAKWVGLMPFSPTSPGAEGWSSSLAIVAVLAKCQLEVWLGGSRTS